MKRIESFCVNHDKLTPGMYVSRIDGDAITYDVRMVVPNAGVYLENDGIHTFEHLFATYVRNTADSDNILYVGPMGCRTGFYFITRDKISKARAIEYLEAGYVVIVGGGTSNPYFTTDSASALRGIEIEADVLLKGTRVDGVYTADPEKDPAAVKFDEISFEEVLDRRLKVMDLHALPRKRLADHRLRHGHRRQFGQGTCRGTDRNARKTIKLWPRKKATNRCG